MQVRDRNRARRPARPPFGRARPRIAHCRTRRFVYDAPVRSLLLLLALAACGDNVPGDGPELAQADTLIVVAHFDDDEIFMQPELVQALQGGTVTTVFVASGDPVHGNGRAQHTFEAAQHAYEAIAGSRDWQCGYITIGELPAHHCRLADRVSMIGLDLPDGGIAGAYRNSLLHLVEGDVAALPVMGPIGGRANEDAIVDELAAIITATAPSQLHTLDLAATHGYDHSSHMLASAFTFWAAARAGYTGDVRFHRGYNVENEVATLPDADYANAAHMLGYFEACYFGCGPCGTSCTKLDAAHETWLRRQYSYTRVASADGALAAGDACAIAQADGTLALGDCASATALHLGADGHLRAGALCVAAAPDDSVALAPCADVPAQFWLHDTEGGLWNALPPRGVWDMDYEHVRCLAASSPASAPACGAADPPAWQFHSL